MARSMQSEPTLEVLPRKPFHEQVAEQLIRQLEQGTAPWQRPWQADSASSLFPVNPTTGKRYRGVNALYLMAQGRADCRWLTYRQAQSVGAQVRKGERGTTIQYWKFSDERPALSDGEPMRDDAGRVLKVRYELERPKVFLATVFNGEQVEGLPRMEAPSFRWPGIDGADRIVQASGAQVFHDARVPCYRPATDSIHMPLRESFAAASAYYATVLHELGHWTGHGTRLARDLAHPFGSEGYAKEELRAEIASMLLGQELGIGHDPGQHAAYVGSWIKVLRNDPMEIFRAAADAEKIFGFVTGLTERQRQEEDLSAQERGESSRAVSVVSDHAAADGDRPATASTRIELSVPFLEKDAAKAAGAKWDRRARSWYADSGTDTVSLHRWMTAGQGGPRDVSEQARMEFAAVLDSLGCVLDHEHPVMDGRGHRVATRMDRAGQRSAFYVGYLDGHPAGYAKDNRSGTEVRWKAKGYSLDAETRARLAGEAALKQQERAAELLRQHLDAAGRVMRHLSSLKVATQPTAYLQRKGVTPGQGVYTDESGALTCLPAIDVHGQVWSMQYIQPDGIKRFAKGTRKEGCFHIGGGLNVLADEPFLIIAEGYATARSVAQSIGLPVVTAFDAGNLESVANALHQRFPGKTVIIAGDDDALLAERLGLNPGREKALLAASAVGGLAVFPDFSDSELRAGQCSDFNDLATRCNDGHSRIARVFRVGTGMQTAHRSTLGRC